MGWIAINDLLASADRGRANPGLFGIRASKPDDGILPVGTLQIEVTYVAQRRVPQRVVRFEQRRGWLRQFSITLSDDGTLSLGLRQGDAVSGARLAIAVPPRDTRLRISYAWDAPGRWALLTVENLDQELLYQVEAPAPLPLPVDDICEILTDGAAARLGPETRYLALSDRVEPVGLPTGMLHGTPIETVEGPRRVEHLRLGDVVRTAGSGPMPVRWILRRDVPALGRFRPVRLWAPYFGLSRDLRVAHDHRLLFTGAEAEYLFGEPSVLVQAAHLVDGKAARRDPPREAVVSYYHVLLDAHECLNTAGIWGESLFVGNLARNPEMIATTALAGMPYSAIPRHRRFAHPTLSGLEAQSLTEALSA